MARELLGAAGLQRDRSAGGDGNARIGLVSQGFARSLRKDEKRDENAEIRHEGDRGESSFPEVLSGDRSGERASESG